MLSPLTQHDVKQTQCFITDKFHYLMLAIGLTQENGPNNQVHQKLNLNYSSDYRTTLTFNISYLHMQSQSFHTKDIASQRSVLCLTSYCLVFKILTTSREIIRLCRTVSLEWSLLGHVSLAREIAFNADVPCPCHTIFPPPRAGRSA